MGIFDRWRRKDTAVSPPPAETKLTVPDGHKVAAYRMSPLPSIASSEAVVWLAHLGTSSDEAEDELDEILAGIDALMQGGRPHILLCTGAGQLSSLMAPHNPQVLPHPHGMVVWTVDAAGLAGNPRGPYLVQRWLRCIYTAATRGAPPLQYVFLREAVSPQARAVSALVRGLGLDVRVPDAREAPVLIEVHRPEGVILSAIAGTPPSPADPADSSALQVNKAKDRAEEDADAALLQRLETDERHALENKLAAAPGEPRVSPVQRAPRLRKLLLAAADQGDAARPALYEELLRREVPLQVIVDPRTMAASRNSWPDGVDALPVYADESSLLASARDRGMELGSFAGAIMPPPKLFDWAASQSGAIAMNTYRTPDQPVYVVLAAEVVKALAQGKLPPRPAMWLSPEVSHSDEFTLTTRYMYRPNEDIGSVAQTFPPASFATVDVYLPMDGLVIVVVEVTVTPMMPGPAKFTTTFRLPSGDEIRKPWGTTQKDAAAVFRAILTIPENARHVATALSAS